MSFIFYAVHHLFLLWVLLNEYNILISMNIINIPLLLTTCLYKKWCIYSINYFQVFFSCGYIFQLPVPIEKWVPNNSYNSFDCMMNVYLFSDLYFLSNIVICCDLCQTYFTLTKTILYEYNYMQFILQWSPDCAAPHNRRMMNYICKLLYLKILK